MGLGLGDRLESDLAASSDGRLHLGEGAEGGEQLRGGRVRVRARARARVRVSVRVRVRDRV